MVIIEKIEPKMLIDNHFQISIKTVKFENLLKCIKIYFFEFSALVSIIPQLIINLGALFCHFHYKALRFSRIYGMTVPVDE